MIILECALYVKKFFDIGEISGSQEKILDKTALLLIIFKEIYHLIQSWRRDWPYEARQPGGDAKVPIPAPGFSEQDKGMLRFS
jgi:hypothetical protein